MKKCLGDDVFEDSSRYAGKFWSLLETRPYMRLLQAQVKVFFDNGDYEKSAYVFSSYQTHCLFTVSILQQYHHRNAATLPRR